MDRAVRTLRTAYPLAEFRPADGHTELAVAEAAASDGTRPEKATRLLYAVYARIDQEACSPDLVRRLGVGGREWLLQAAAERYTARPYWFEADCSACGKRYDLALSREGGNRKEAAADYPVVSLDTSLGSRRFEAPNGWHEEALARSDGLSEARRGLVGLCGLSQQAAQDAARFDDDDINKIDRALEDISPEVADTVSAHCPNCGAETQARLDPLTYGFPNASKILSEVHLLARSYAWPESDILALPSARRSCYAALIAAERGVRNRPVGMVST